MAYIHKDYSRFVRDHTIKAQEMGTEESLNRASLKLKKETNDTFNRIQVSSNEFALAWVNVEFYEEGEICSYQNINYIALRDNQNKTPNNHPNDWKVLDPNELSRFNYSNILPKDNQIPYYTESKQGHEKSTDFHPATKLYVDSSIDYNNKNVKVGNADRLDGHDSSYFVSQDQFREYKNIGITKKDIADNLTTADPDKVLSANQGVVIKDLIDKINKILKSNDVSLDELQEIIEFIKTNRAKLDALNIDSVIGLRDALNKITKAANDAVPKQWWNSDIFRKRITEIDGAGSEIDADKLDGFNSSDFWRKGELNNAAIRELLKQLQGAGSEIDADKLDGLHASSFLRRDANDEPTSHKAFDLGAPTKAWRNIYAENFIGTALQSKFADLAEKYNTDNSYEPGTVLCINNEGLGTMYNMPYKLLGVVSTKPALKLNSESDGVYIALKGLVPVKIWGEARPGQYILAFRDGMGLAVSDYNFEESKRLIGVVIKGGYETCLVKI